MRSVLCALFLLAACSPAPENEAPPPALPPPAPGAWLICDAIDAPVVLAVERNGDAIEIAEYDKPNGAIVARHSLRLGEPEGAAGSVYTPLMRGDEDAGQIRAVNPGMLEAPAGAYTPPVTAVALGDRELTCRWLPRTRLMGFTGRRTVVVHEDADGDLIYTSYDFTAAAAAAPVELSDGARTTTFSVEIRGGQETLTPEGAAFVFNSNGYNYAVRASRAGEGVVEVVHGQPRAPGPGQSEPLIAYQLGSGAE